MSRQAQNSISHVHQKPKLAHSCVCCFPFERPPAAHVSTTSSAVFTGAAFWSKTPNITKQRPIGSRSRHSRCLVLRCNITGVACWSKTLNITTKQTPIGSSSRHSRCLVLRCNITCLSVSRAWGEPSDGGSRTALAALVSCHPRCCRPPCRRCCRCSCWPAAQVLTGSGHSAGRW
jgi:hypothetical protein